MSQAGGAHRLSLEIYEDDYRGDIHSSLPPAIYRSIEEDQDEYVEIFGIEDLNRVLSEGERAGSGWVVEDFAISGSRNDGEIVVGQCVSCRGKEKSYEGKTGRKSSLQPKKLSSGDL